jgi:hypothetical protein|tara:strand:- start:459 stop:1031 length:573 start_codon:yes stop_codon:yes gene_type:complete
MGIDIIPALGVKVLSVGRLSGDGGAGGTMDIVSGGTDTLNIDTTGSAAINIGADAATSVVIGRSGQAITYNAGWTSNGSTNSFGNGANIATGTSTGSKIGTAVTQKIGFWNVTPVVQPASGDQADQGAMTSGAVGDLVATSGGWGASSEANFDIIHTTIDQLVADVAALDTLLTAIRTALVDTGIMKGAA